MSILRVAPLVAATALAGAAVTAQVNPWNPQQGWQGGERSKWYNSPQGSRLIPYSWMVALETKDSTDRFLSPDNIDRFRYIMDDPSKLPIGFALDEQDDTKLQRTHLRWRTEQGNNEPWIGLTCAACHTARIEYNGHKITVDGAPSMGDYQSFVDELNSALIATLKDRSKWDRFAHRVLRGAQYTTENQAALESSFIALAKWQLMLAQADATPLRYGYSRVDAFGHIFNKVAFAVSGNNLGGNPSDAPVSYPHLWGLAEERRVQWNGSVSNSPIKNPIGSGTLDVGALGRNTGEVIGVFGEAYPVNGGLTFKTSVDLKNLNNIETQLRRLQPPKWPSFFPILDPSAVKSGEKLYSTMCASCHIRPGIDSVRKDQGWGTEVMAYFVSRPDVGAADPIDTDDRMACNAYLWSAPSGVLKGANYEAQDPNTGKKVKQTVGSFAAVGTMAPMVVQRTFLGDGQVILAIAWQSLTNNVPPPKTTSIVIPQITSPGIVPYSAPYSAVNLRLGCRSAINDNLGYKARPLNGIWATGPYLHNGSVPNLAQLLLIEPRKPIFYVGSRKFDPANVGFETDQNDRNSFRFDTFLPGNGNGGHIYGVDQLSLDKKRQLLEYLKSL